MDYAKCSHLDDDLVDQISPFSFLFFLARAGRVSINTEPHHTSNLTEWHNPVAFEYSERSVSVLVTTVLLVCNYVSRQSVNDVMTFPCFVSDIISHCCSICHFGHVPDALDS